MDSLPPSSKEFRYLDAWRRAEDCGDQFDPESHGFSDSECVQGWATLLTSSTQAYKPLTNGQPDVEGRHVTIRLGFAHPLITEAARRTFDGHTQRTHGPEADVAMTSRPASPTSSTSSTASDVSHSSATPPPPSTAPAAPLSRCARLSSISVSPCYIRYTCTTVSNWPREHPTELCGGDDQLAAFLRLNAPDLRITTTDLFGSTDPSTTVICEPQHLHQLQRLQGKTSLAHGIHPPQPALRRSADGTTDVHLLLVTRPRNQQMPSPLFSPEPHRAHFSSGGLPFLLFVRAPRRRLQGVWPNRMQAVREAGCNDLWL